MASPASHPGDEWFFAGLASSFPDITDSNEKYFKLAWPQPCNAPQAPSSDEAAKVPGCKVFHPITTPSTAKEIDMDTAVGEDAWVMREQVLVFQYKGKFHAVDHACPHRAYSLSWGQPFDIEDAGKVVGQGIRCKGHSYAFELSTGIGDRGNYKLGIWDVELRPSLEEGDAGEAFDKGKEDLGREVWVRRKRKS